MTAFWEWFDAMPASAFYVSLAVLACITYVVARIGPRDLQR